MSSLIVALECSQRDGGIAVRGDDGVTRSGPIESASGIDDRLMTVLDGLLAEIAASPADIARVGVSIGPGGFTGLRVAVSTAKMLALTTGCEVVPVPTALVAARSVGGRCAVCLSSKRGTTWLTVINAEGEIEGTPAMVDAAQAMTVLDGVDVLVADDALPEGFEEAAQARGIKRVGLALDPAACLDLAVQGTPVDPHGLLPLYGRIPEAQRLWH